MDFNLLQKPRAKRPFFRRHVKSGYPSAVESAPAAVRNGFYYIGKNPDNIGKLVRVFRRGYASRTIENAVFELKRAIEQENNAIPEIIICEGDVDVAAMEQFSGFLRHDPLLCGVPFITDVEELSEQALDIFKNK
jgi:hypothetical protein